ncbi:hypothetical protein ABZ770_30420 [Streptomyces sp. NPDC006654]|uniref:alanine-zipper protein n=1 Tax=Streptomyces sp. NPDC006654 TaxID=3156897 RepID=UPI00340F814C
MDLDAVVDELYRLAPGDFTAIRDERARTARADGDRQLAERIRRLRRPTLAAWASNLLVREQPEEAERLLRLGAALRQAHRDLDGEQLRELSARQHQLTFALSGQAGRLAAEAGQRISDEVRQEVQDTLHAVLADPETAAQWAEGQLTKPLRLPAGFPTPLPGPEQAPAPRRRTRPAKEVADLDAARARRQEQQARLDRARQQAADAERELHAREGELAAVEEEGRRAEAGEQQAEQRVGELSRRLQEARRDQRRARDAAREARDRSGEAERAVREARRRAEEATARVHKLTERQTNDP